MHRHLTVRKAWHDHGWDGTICRNPSANSYCAGAHSLLSERVARHKRVDREEEKRGQSLDVHMPDYLPPYYWTTFAPATVQVVHDHAFAKFRKTKNIPEALPPKWRERLAGYDAAILGDCMLTTDDLAGLRQVRIDAAVHNLLSGKLAGSAEIGFSQHNYRL